MKKVEPIVKLAADFANVLRVLKYREGHTENDAEHSYQLAMACWSANHQYGLELDDEKILKYALVHDLVELYAGDTDAFGNKAKIAAKAANEKKALEKLKKEFAEFTEILSAIDAYNQKKEPEAQLVNVLDKLIAEINIHSSNDNYYQRRKTTLSAWKSRLFSKIKYDTLDEKLKQIVDESVREVETRYKQIFYQGR